MPDPSMAEQKLIDENARLKQRILELEASDAEHKRAEEALRESEARLRDITFNLGDWVWEVDRNGVYAHSSQTGFDLLGRSRGDIVGKTPFDFMPPDEASKMAATFADIAAHKAPIVDLENWNIGKNGERICLLTNGVPMLDEEGNVTGYRGVDRDITQRKHAEAEKARLEAQLWQSQKMESVGRLAGGVAHDFNNMLGVILGRTELALEQVAPEQSIHADLTEIHRAAARSARLARQLLAFARKQIAMPRVLDLNETVDSMLTMLRRLIGEDIDLKWQPAADLWRVKVDPSQVDQILTNLLVNARDAITGVGTVTIQTANSTVDQDACTDHPGLVPGEYVRLVASDDGCGMDTDTQSHLFEPFFTTKELGKGTGLGLATVYGIVTQNNGFIDVDTEPGRGTTFSIYLPRHLGNAEPSRLDDPASATAPGRETILLVEDEPAILALATTVLERKGYTVLAARTPGEAIRLATQHARPIHLLMTDVIMPEMNGRDLARTLLSLYPRIGRLFMSGYTADVIAHHGVLDPDVSFLQKPFSVKELAAKVRETLDRESGPS
jgi:PAS domain S-box-containing protein